MSASDAPRPPQLWIGTPEAGIEVPEEGVTVIGRAGDLVVGADNPHMHRRLLTVTPSGADWHLANVGRFIPVAVQTPDERPICQLDPGETTVIAWPEFLLAFAAGEGTYHLDCYAELPITGDDPLSTLHGTETIGVAALDDADRMLLAAIAEPILRSPTRDYSLMRKNSEAIERLGWTRPADADGTPEQRKKRFDHRLDNICRTFAEAGVTGVIGGKGNNASNRRIKVIQYAIEAQLITAEDIDLVDREAACGGVTGG